MKSVAWTLVIGLAGCGAQPILLPRPNTPVVTQGNTPLPDPIYNDPTPLTEPPSNKFSGTVAELWALPTKTSGIAVTIPVAIVTSNSGNGQSMYVNDPTLSDASGIAVDRCTKDDTTCKQTAPPRGTQVKILGTLFTNRDGGANIGKATVTAVPDAQPITPEARLAYVKNVEKGNITGNEAIRATLVHLLSDDETDARFVVDNLTPSDDMNGAFPADLEDKCGIGKTIPTGVSCCPAGIGPKYYSFTVKEISTGKIVSIGSGNYKDIDFSSFPCGAADAAKALKLGDEFVSLGGIFDVTFGKGSVSPADTSDYVLIRH